MGKPPRRQQLSHRLRPESFEASQDQTLALVEQCKVVLGHHILHAARVSHMCYSQRANLLPTEGMGNLRNLTRVGTARDLAPCIPMDVRQHVNTGYPAGYRQRQCRWNQGRYSVSSYLQQLATFLALHCSPKSQTNFPLTCILRVGCQYIAGI